MYSKDIGHHYVLEGDLTPLVRNDRNKKRIWDFTAAFRVTNSLSLREQHANRPFFEGPLHVDCIFYLKFPGAYYKAKEYNGRYNLAKPCMSGLFVFVETVGVDILYRCGATIVSVSSSKMYDSDRPRVEFTFYEMNPREIAHETQD